MKRSRQKISQRAADAALKKRIRTDIKQIRSNVRLVDRLGRTCNVRIALCPRCGWPGPKKGRR